MSDQLDQRIREAMQHVVDEAPPPPDPPASRPTIPAERRRLPNWVAAPAVAALVLLSVGIGTLLFRMNDADGGNAAVSSSTDGQTVSVTVSGVSGRMGDEFAAVLYEGGDLSDLDREALGGFWAVISSDEQSLTEVVRQPGEFDVGQFPYVSDAALTVEPGTYTLVLWVDEALGPVSRWVPLNSYVPGDPLIEGMDLYGCHMVFDVGDDPLTNVVIPANLHHNGWNVDCVSGAVIPGTNAAAAVAPTDFDLWEELPTAMDPVTGLHAGQSLSVKVTGVTDHVGHELAGVLYAGGELTDLDAEALGGFWAVIEGDDYTTTEVIRTPAADLIGRFPFVSNEALTVEPGTYTLVVWVDHALGTYHRWVPINTDGQGLYGCHVVFEVGTDTQTDVVVPANLYPDGWNTNCTTGATIPGTDAGSAVTPSEWPEWPEVELPTEMPPVVGAGDGQTVSVTVSGVSGRVGHDLAGVLYEGDWLTDLDRDPLGGFWSVIADNDFTATEVLRQPGDIGMGRFPFVTDEALTIEPGTYTLVIWVDHALNPASRWVPINTDGQGLYGCHVVFEVGTDTQTDVVVPANLHPDGWNTNCTTGATIPGTDAGSAVTP